TEGLERCVVHGSSGQKKTSDSLSTHRPCQAFHRYIRRAVHGLCTGLVHGRRPLRPPPANRTRLGRNTRMSLALVQSRALLGLQAPPVTVEVHLANGLPSFTLVGLAEVEVKEARERVRSALQNAGLEFPHNKRITVNL